MKEVMRIAAFAGDKEIETAISERLGYTGDIIDELGLALPDGGTPPVDGFCQAVCDLSGMTCHVVQDTGDGYRFEKTLAPSSGHGSADGFIDLLVDIDE